MLLRRAPARALALLAALCSAACASPSPSDGGLSDASAERAAPGLDASNAEVSATEASACVSDASGAQQDSASARAAYTCMPCQVDGQCGDDGACVADNPALLPGVRHCRVRCDSAGAPCSAGGIPSRCGAGPDGWLVCLEPASCVASRLGQPCTPQLECAGRYSVCSASTAGAVAVCLAPCASNADCEDGFARCLPVRDARGGGSVLACAPDPAVGPSRCGLAPANARGVGAPCGPSGACDGAARCLTVGGAEGASFCSLDCGADADCGEGARCVAPGSGSARCVPLDCDAFVARGDTALDAALGALGADRARLYFDTSPQALATLGGVALAADRFRLPFFERVHTDWLAGARWAQALGPALDSRAASLARVLSLSESLRTTGSLEDAASPVVDPACSDGSLAESAARFLEGLGATPDRGALARDAEDVPPELQRALAAVLDAALRVALARERGLALLGVQDGGEALYLAAPHLLLAARQGTVDVRRGTDMAAALDPRWLPVAEASSLAALVHSVDWSRFRGLRGPSFDVATPAGRVVLRDGANHVYEEEDYPELALLVDLGGDDVYRARVGANASPRNSVSVLVDLDGADRYGYAEVPSPADTVGLLPGDRDGRFGVGATSASERNRQGSGRLGVGLLFDLGGGNDVYLALRASQGFGALGVGGLFDDGGDDSYLAESASQGVGAMGVGILLDRGGSDTYDAWAWSQGLGFVRGVGVLHDASGGDAYTCRAAPVLFPSEQDRTANRSACQGMGFGLRIDDRSLGVAMGGGLGVLRDLAGNDRYSASVFAQGSGYWSGAGVLADAAGDDEYEGRWYAQGSAAHSGFGALVDGGGRDRHNLRAVRQRMTAGAGNDRGLGLLLALGAESDEYHVPDLGLGAGIDDGAGLFLDEGGDDLYAADNTVSCGAAELVYVLDNPARVRMQTTGLFLEQGGTDRYQRAGVAGADLVRDGARWVQRLQAGQLSELGAGVDGEWQDSGLR